MKDMRTNYAAVGGFVLVMLILLVVSVGLLTGRQMGTDLYTTHLHNVSGLKYGSKVTYEGFVIGQVEDMSAVGSATDRPNFRLTLSVRQGWAIPQGSIARIASPGILAAPTLDIKGGSSAVMLPPGSDLPGGPTASIFAVMNEMSGQVAVLSQQGLLPLLVNLNQRVDAMGGLLQDKAPDLLANLLAVSGDVRKMSQTLSTQVVTDNNARAIGATLQNMQELSAGLQDSRRKMDAVTNGLDKLIEGNRGTMESALKDLRYTVQTVSRSIDSITYNLDSTSRNVNEFSRQIRDNPGVLISGTKGREDGSGRREGR